MIWKMGGVWKKKGGVIPNCNKEKLKISKTKSDTQ
jgi:hypothetical protein